jgi:hypothetical protein
MILKFEFCHAAGWLRIRMENVGSMSSERITDFVSDPEFTQNIARALGIADVNGHYLRGLSLILGNAVHRWAIRGGRPDRR